MDIQSNNPIHFSKSTTWTTTSLSSKVRVALQFKHVFFFVTLVTRDGIKLDDATPILERLCFDLLLVWPAFTKL